MSGPRNGNSVRYVPILSIPRSVLIGVSEIFLGIGSDMEGKLEKIRGSRIGSDFFAYIRSDPHPSLLLYIKYIIQNFHLYN